MSRLVVISNRVTPPVRDKSGSAGGLATALHAALRKYDGFWFGWSGEAVDSVRGRAETENIHGAEIATVDLTHEDVEEYYNGFANRTLWPLFHYRIDLTDYDRQFDTGYFRVNRFFAHSVRPLIEPDDLIWFHDYHLIPCGAELRQMGLANRMGFFLHIPWPAPQVLATLPKATELVRALFAYDLIGFQTEGDVETFKAFIRREISGEIHDDGRITCFGRTARVAAFPIGIDYDDFRQMAASEEAQRNRERMTASLSQRRMIIGVDRLDYSKGIANRFQAYASLLEQYPENRNQVLMLQVAPPSREQVPAYQELRDELDTLAGQINGSYADFDWVPLRYVTRGYPRPALAGLFQAAKVCLVTPLRDGMNLVAKEYVAAQDPDDPGVLVLSRFAGAAQQMGSALIVNPYDHQDMVDALQTALTMPLEERRERWSDLNRTVQEQNVLAWRDEFVSALRDVAR